MDVGAGLRLVEMCPQCRTGRCREAELRLSALSCHHNFAIAEHSFGAHI